MFIQFLFCEHRFLPFGEVKAHKVNNQIQEVLDALELSGVSPIIKGKAVFFFFESTMSVAGLGEGSGPHLIIPFLSRHRTRLFVDVPFKRNIRAELFKAGLR